MKLRLATDSEKRERDVLTHPEWGRRLTVEQYQAREQRLRSHRYSQRAMQTWFLEEGGKILSSCETFRMQSFVDGNEGHAYGVASVFTAASLRGQGHALAMMKELSKALCAQDDRAQAALLFSDVGEVLYERAGYKARPGKDRLLPPSRSSTAVIAITEATLAAELAEMKRPNVPVLVWPSADQLDWHLERERIYAEALGKPRPSSVGARAGESRIIWAGYYASDLLAVLLLDARNADETRALLAAAQNAAAEAQLSRVQLWESSAYGDWEPAVAQLPPTEREGYLPMLRGFVEGADAERWPFIPRALWI